MSISLSGSLLITGSLTASGTLTAQTLVVQTVTSSIVYSSGSNVFGNSSTDTQKFTGSVLISGSSTFSNNIILTGGYIENQRANETRTVWERYSSATYFQRISSNGAARQLRLESNGAYGNASIVLDGQSNDTVTTTIVSDKFVVTGSAILSSTVATTGVIFPATQVASANVNTLDDYEEGTWTPAFAGAGTPTHTTQFGRYTKIGNMVYCTIALRATSISGGSTIQITGLPFSAGDASDTGQRATYAPYLGGHINGVTETTARFRVAGNLMDGVKGNGDTTYMTAAQFCSGGSVQITGNFWYYV